MVRLTHVAILESDQILIATNTLSAFSFSELQGGVEWTHSYSSLGSKALLAFCREGIQMSFHILSLLLKLERVWTVGELMIRILTS